MSLYAPPVVRGDFQYDSVSGLFTVVGSDRVLRQDASALHALLSAAPATAGSRSGSTARDPPESFYVGQLVHYGLKPLKTKAAARKALVTASGLAPGAL